MKRTPRASSSPALPTVRALPPQRRRLSDVPGFAPAVRIAGGVLVALVIFGGAFGAVLALERGALPPSTIPLASLAVLAATAAYLAGRNEGKKEVSTSAERSRAKGRLGKGAAAAADRVAAATATSTAAGAVSHDTTGATAASQSGVLALRTKFLDDISQALRAPITSICLAARIIRKHYDSTPEVVAHFGDTLLAEADRLGQTVDEFLELARLESGLIEWNDIEVDAADLIQRAVAEVEPVAVSYGVSVAFTMEPGLPPLHVDRERISQALTILLAMAVRSASEGSEIVIQIAGAHGGWIFTVGGTSFVYPHAEARKVHVRADGNPAVEPLESQPDGLGLGICLCREIVSRYQGRMWIEGTPGTSGCARFTIPYRQHRRATTTASASASSSTTQHGDRADATTGGEAAKSSQATVSPVDLEQRREMAVKALQERAASQPRTDAVPSQPNDGVEAKAPAADDATATPASAQRPSATPATNDAAETPLPNAASALASDEASQACEGAVDNRDTASRPRPKLSFGRTQTSAAPSSPAHAAPTPGESPRQVEERTPTDSSPQGLGEAVARDEAKEAEEVEIEIDDAPVHAPVSGTMITATHRTAGPPVLANPGVPALSGVQSAANAAMQGSDDLLLEIAEAQSPDGRALIVSEEVRSLLASAPGTLPAVAGANSPAVAGRSSYTPSRRRMVQAPWVVRSGADSQSSDPDAPSAAAQAQATEPAAPGQRARLNERLAKRLGLTASSQPGRNDTRPASGSGAYMRSRRLGSR